ncbi:MAG: hypothetical protein OEW42_01805 [Acidimicrobiia bacterium]|nr:hypothetical protein [Acidimicrobiia bacterium]
MKSVAIVGVALLLAAGSCASDGDDPVTGTTTTTGTSTTTPAATIGPVLDHSSSASITINDQTWEFAVSCTQPAEGDVLVWGSGRVPGSELPSDILLEASATTPYIGVTGGGQLIEAALDSPLILTIDAGTITGDGITFVADADIDTGVGTVLGTGGVQVQCGSYETTPTVPN